MNDWTLCGWRVRSDIPLPETLPWSGAEDHPVDVTVRLGNVPEGLPTPVYAEPLIELGADGEYHLTIRNVGRYLTRDGRNVLVDPFCPIDLPDLRLFVETSCLAALALQRGLIALHGAVARVSGKTIAILGSSGQGKSTLAAALAQKGHGLMAEDVCVLDFSGGNDHRPMVVPSLPNVRLWEDALEYLGIDQYDVVPSRMRLRKYHVVRPDWFHARPEPLDAVVLLAEARPPSVLEGLHPTKGARPIGAVCQYVHRPRLAARLGLQPKMVTLATRLVRERRVFELGTVRDLKRLPEITAMIESLAASLDG